MLESTTRGVLIQTRNLEHTTIKGGTQLRVFTILPTGLERSMLRLFMKSSDRDVAERRCAVEFAIRRERETVVAVRKLRVDVSRCTVVEEDQVALT